ncbi:hypothetical protein M8J76_009399 [Diaphorina citri]|nr:hypothetical protein M8J76_009399 [Diaphorina citri]KAI5756231.1 hypothetical protein M8J77_023218 [Diaphorina citri]
MSTPSNQNQGMSKLDPQTLLQTKTHVFMKSTPLSHFDYVKAQFLSADRKALEQHGLTLDDIFLMDRIYMQSSAIPFFLTRGLVRKTMLSKINTSDDKIDTSTPIQPPIVRNQYEKRLSKQEDFVGMNGVNKQTPYTSRSSDGEFNNSSNNRVGSQKNLFSSNDKLTNGFKTQSNVPHINNNVNQRHTHQQNGYSQGNNSNRTKFKNINKDCMSSSSADEGSICSFTESVQNVGNKSHKNNKFVNKESCPVGDITDKFEKVIKPKNLLSTIGNIRQHSQASTNSSAIHPAPNVDKTYNVVFGDRVQGSECYLVTKECDISNLEEIHNQLKSETLQPWSNESEVKKVVTVIDSKYYRGFIVQNNEPELKGTSCIKLVDVGWYVAFDPNQTSHVYVLPDNCKSLKPLAFAVHTDHPALIQRHSHATILETGKYNEKVKSITIKQFHPVSTISKSMDAAVTTITENPNKKDDLKLSPIKPENVTRTRAVHSTGPDNNCYSMKQEINKVDILPLNSPVQVIWLQREESSTENHWVQDVKYYDFFEDWQILAKEENSKLDKMPQLGDYCLKMYEDEWCRTKVVAKEPLTLFYVDFGVTEVANSFQELKPLPKKMGAVVSLAYKIKFYNSKNNEIEYNFGDSFNITPINYCDNIYTVLKEKETSVPIENHEIMVPKETKTTSVTKPIQTSKNIVGNYKYEGAIISQHEVELNKRLEVNFIQDDETNAEYKWVQDVQFADQLMKWQDIVNHFNSPFTLGTAQPGDFCVKLFEDMWCRAKIVSCNPLTLFYIDFGNIEIVDDISQVKPLPEQLSQVKPLAIKVEFYHKKNNVPMEYGKCFFITPVDTKNDVYIVLKDGESIQTRPSTQEAKTSTNTMRYYYKDSAINSTSSVELNKRIKVAFVQNDTENLAHKWVQDIQFYNYMEEWTNISIRQTNKFDQKPNVGEYCVHFYEEAWCRAKVIQVEPITVFYIDYGNQGLVTNIEELKPLPKELSAVKPLAHKIKFFFQKNTKVSYNFGDTLDIIPFEVKDHVLIVLKDGEILTDVISRVYRSPVPNLVLNKPVEAAWVQDDEFDNMYTWVQDISRVEYTEKFAQVLSHLSEEFTQIPQVGDLCGKLYEEIWCRAKVVSLKPLTIFYIDYGNTEKVNSVADLKPLPKNIAQYPGIAFRILFEKEKPNLTFGELFTFTPISLVDNVYTASI